MGNAASSLPFAIGKQVAFCNNGWAVHEGSRKSDGERVSVFTAKKPTLLKTAIHPRANPNLTQYAAAMHHFMHCKKLRHPHILQVLATLDTDRPNESTGGNTGNNNHTSNNNDASAVAVAASSSVNASKTNNTGDLIIVTEPCVSLDMWLQSSPPPEQVAWGLESIVRGVHFLHTSQMLHGNLSPESFVVTPAGDVKIWNFSLVSTVVSTTTTGKALSSHFIEWEQWITPQIYRSPERMEGRWDAIAHAGIHCVDSFALGKLIQQIFSAQGGGGVPTKLIKAVQRLETANLKMRPRLQPLLKCPVFDTPYQKLQLQLQELTVQPPEQKVQFWQNVTPNLQAGLVPEQLAVHKLLPLIKQSIQTICLNESMRAQEMYRREVLSTVNPLFYIAENFLDTETVGKQLGQVIGILFKVNDRAIRGTLLQKAPFMAQSFDKNTLNESVFEPMCSGFSDSSAALRDLTLKATAALVPHLSHPNLEKLSRYLVRLQGDQEPSIRTNTVIFFSKLAPYLTEVTRQKMLLPAFVRAMNDPFTPCRMAALKSTLKAKEFFDPAGVASRVLPAVTPQLLDSSGDVRLEAFAAVDALMFVLRQESERMNSLPEPQQANGSSVMTSATAPHGRPVPPKSNSAGAAVPEAPKSGGGFSLGGISSWMTSKTVPEQAPKSAPSPAQARAPPQQHSAPQAVPPQAPATAMNGMNLGSAVSDDWDDDLDDDDADGWGDDLDLSGGGGSKGNLAAPTQSAQPAASGSLFAPAASEDDFFGGFDSKPARPIAPRKPGGGGKLVMPAKKLTVKPAVKKLALNDSATDDWDDF